MIGVIPHEHDPGRIIVAFHLVGTGADAVRAAAPSIPCRSAGTAREDLGIRGAEVLHEAGIGLCQAPAMPLGHRRRQEHRQQPEY